MTHPSKRKGDRAELEVQSILRDLLGWTYGYRRGIDACDEAHQRGQHAATEILS